MSWLASLGLLLGIIGAGLFRVPTVRWDRFQRFVYRHSPRVRHYQYIKGIFSFVMNGRVTGPLVISSQATENDLPHEISENTARILYGVLESTDFYSPSNEKHELQSIRIEDGMFIFLFNNNTDYRIGFEEGINRFRIAKDGFLNEYYTEKGALFLVAGFIIQLVETLPLF